MHKMTADDLKAICRAANKGCRWVMLPSVNMAAGILYPDAADENYVRVEPNVAGAVPFEVSL